jgi:hypothetical protein
VFTKLRVILTELCEAVTLARELQAVPYGCHDVCLRDHNERLPIQQISSVVGSRRLQLVNGIACRRRVAKLHGPGGYFLCRYFLCRHCYRLAHASQSEGAWHRALRRANKIWERLGGDPGTADLPLKPEGMWQRTYERLVEEVFKAEMRAAEAFVVQGELFRARPL